VLGNSCWLQAELVAAREHLEQALALHDPDAGRTLSAPAEADPLVVAQLQLGTILWALGYPDQGRASFRQALARAEAIAQPPSLAFAHNMMGYIYLSLGRDGAAVLRHSQGLRAAAHAGREYGPRAELLAAWALAHEAWRGRREDPAGAKATLDRALAGAAQAGSALEALGAGTGHELQLLVRAQICAWAGQAGMALAALDRAGAWMERTGMRYEQAEVWRMRGELLLRENALTPLPPSSAPGRGGEDEAEACFHRALEIARGQQGRWLELRATVSLARLWHATGRGDEGRELLAGIYAWFTEGFDTVDLVEARALLDELA
jgi:adenylate cyclase